MTNKCFIALYFFMALSSCSDKSITNDDIDKFISRYNEASFSDFMNVSISYRDGDFGDEFVQVARSVYFTNDLRSEVKRKINIQTNSSLIEEKSYEEYS